MPPSATTFSHTLSGTHSCSGHSSGQRMGFSMLRVRVELVLLVLQSLLTLLVQGAC